MTLEASEKIRDVGHAQMLFDEQARHEIALERQPSALDVLGGVERISPGHALTPTFSLVRLDADEKRLADRLGAERCAKGRYEGETDPAQLDGVKLHGLPFSSADMDGERGLWPLQAACTVRVWPVKLAFARRQLEAEDSRGR